MSLFVNSLAMATLRPNDRTRGDKSMNCVFANRSILLAWRCDAPLLGIGPR